MRPIKLTMQAFGPYAETQVLDMDALGETGIYAITGETGAGKTTIFDAIVYALYGSASGEDRGDTSGLRALAARPDLETRVALEFASGGKRYAIERRPAQWLAGKRTDGLVEKKAAQALTLPDGRVVTREREIREAIERDVLGVTKDQFCQIVMIAQGEFRKLLRADTEARTVILRRIFRTERYNALAQQMDRLCKARYGEWMDARKQVAFSLNALNVDPASPLYEAHAALKQTPLNALIPDDAVELARQVVAADEAAHAEAEAALGQAQANRDRSRAALEAATALARKREAAEALRRESEAQRENLLEAQRRRDAAQAERPEIERLGAQIATDAALLPQYASLRQMESEQARTERELAAAQADGRRAEAEEASLKARQDALAREAEALKDADRRRLEAANALNALREAGARLRELDRRVRRRDAAAQALEGDRALAQSAALATQSAAEELKALESARDALGNTELALSRIRNRQEALEAASRELEALEGLQGDYRTALDSYAAARAVYAEREAEARELRAGAVEGRSRYNANIAGVWADALQEGVPCPVCGSVHHPRKAALCGERVTEAEVNAAEERAAEAERRFNDQAVTCSRRKEARDGLRRQLAERLADIPEADWPGTLAERAKENAAERTAVSNELHRAEADDARQRQLASRDIPRAQAALEAATAQKNAAERQLRVAEAALAAAEGEVADAAEGVLPEGWTSLDLSDAISENERQLKAQQARLEHAEADVRRLEEIADAQAEAAEALAAAVQAIGQAAARASGLSAGLLERGRAIDALRQRLQPYPTEEGRRAVIDAMTRRRAALEEAIETTRRAVSELSERLAGTQGQLRQLEGELRDAPVADADALAAEAEACQTAWESASKREKAAHARREGNAAQCAALVAQADAARALESEYRVMQDVADTANGRVRGQSRVTLEAYVQAAYFDRIIRYANRRLIHISRHQYDLARRSADAGGRQGKTGLDLDVVDHANGRRRAVGTLSGGESFLASLAFALGMSDAIQASAATAVQLDTMFVDEGFGSLSENYLRLVMDELNDTAASGHRLIGVISHVEDVKEGIDRRIEVTKDPNGISRAEIR